MGAALAETQKLRDVADGFERDLIGAPFGSAAPALGATAPI